MLGAPIRLVGPAAFERPWQILWRPFLAQAVADPVRVEVGAHPWGFSIVAPGREINAIDAWRALIESRNDVIRLGLESLEDVFDLHAAVLVRDGRAVVLLGDMWAGKTTIALYLVAHGWRYFSDDLAVIGLADGLVRPVPKPPGVKAQPWDEMKHFWPEPPGLDPPSGPFLIPPPFVGSLDERASPTFFVFLRYETGADVELTPMSAAEAVAQAGEHLGRVNKESLKALANVALRCQHVRMTYGSSADAGARLRGIRT